ncbi:hypothetical protein MA03_01295 [Infirmifilum uzonense]|uniref:Uncharacterized protein n=1 Tax=Infirmifilum uzonense TaxID=1550241 RepID=A0A0F7FGF6_9CREN|nr:hypothetical protein [Infirmifilum uzonense]AKG38195.1 hypothetical protein MA03_01295 [Infirmifilum uzonense]
MIDRASRGKRCPQGYFTGRLADILKRGVNVDELEALALEIIITETYLKKILERISSDEMMEEIRSVLKEIEDAKKMIYRIYRYRMFEDKKSRVALWR